MAVPVNIQATSQEKGYPVEILINPDFDRKFQCNHCSLILRDPIQSYCGHRFCRKCIEGVISSGTQVRCQSCMEEGSEEDEYSILRQEQMFPDNALKKEMIKLDVKCINPGCDWKGQFRKYDAHLSECKYKPQQCSQCGGLVESSKLHVHMTTECPGRKIRCKYCNEEITVSNNEEHNTVCLKFPMKCDACGKKKIPREKVLPICGYRELWTLILSSSEPNVIPDCLSSVSKLVPQHIMHKFCASFDLNVQMQFHIDKECTQQKVQCLPECGSMSRDSYTTHLDKKPGIHITAINEKVLQMEVEVNRALADCRNGFGQLQEKVQQQEEAIQHIIAPGGQVPVVSGGEQELSALRARCQTLELKTGTFEGIVTTLHREIERCITALETSDRQRLADKQKLEESERKIMTLERTLSLKDVALAELDLRIKSLELISFDGTLIWKVTEWSKKRREAQAGTITSIYSPIFYTSRNGYKMCVRLYPNGDGMGKNSHLSIFFVVMRGYFDALLSWPFTHRVTFMLLDQNNREHVVDSFRPDPTSSSFRRPTSDMNIASGCPLFMPQTKLDDPNLAYVKDDTMFIKISVDLTNVSRVGSST